MRYLLDGLVISPVSYIGWQPQVALEEGILAAYNEMSGLYEPGSLEVLKVYLARFWVRSKLANRSPGVIEYSV